MSELIALSRLAFARSRWIAGLSFAYLVLVILVATVSTQIPLIATDWWKSNITFLLMFASLPTLLTAFAIFGFGEEKDLDDQGTSYPGWLLRSPIASWKLAVVPSVMKTLWALMICGLLWIAAGYLGTPMRHWLVPGLVVSIIGTLMCAVGWRPFHWRYTRLTILALAILPSFVAVLYAAAYAFLPELHVSYLPDHWMPRLIAWATYVVYGFSIWMSVRSIRLARCNVIGKIPERAWIFSNQPEEVDSSFPANDIVRYRHAARHSAIRSILFYHLSMLRNLNASKLIVAVYLIVLTAACLASNAELTGLIILTVLLWTAGGLLTEVTYSQLEKGRLPNLIASAPVATATFAWTRQVFVTLVGFIFLLGIPLVLSAWHLTGASETMIRSIDRSLAFSIGEGTNATWALFAAGVIAMLLVARQTTWTVITISSTNRRLGLYWFAAGFVVLVAMLSAFMIQFMKFPDWESWRSWAGEQSRRYINGVFLLAAVKLSVAGWACASLFRSNTTSNRAIATILVAYLIIVAVAGSVVRACLPFPAIGPLHWCAAIATITPLSRILIAPVVLDANRHRN